MSSQKGVTLIELMIAIGVMAIVVSMALPRMQSVIESNRVTSQANTILAGLQFARSEAVKRGGAVSFSAGEAGNVDYAVGWCVHTGASCSGASIIKRQETGGDGIDFGGVTLVTFDARGQRLVPSGTADSVVTLQPDGCPAGAVGRQRSVVVTIAGRPSVGRGDCS